MHPHLCQHLSDFVCFFFSLVRAPESRVNQGSGFPEAGEVCSGEV